MKTSQAPTYITHSTQPPTHPPPIYLNGLILFPDKTPPLFAPATYLYIQCLWGCCVLTRAIGGVTHEVV